jgi:SAM-dependent methyltransferase
VPSEPAIATGNLEQFRAWNGDDGAFWAENADRLEHNIADFQTALLAAADIQPTERILDVGCGTGGSSCDAARLASRGSVLALDLSRPMLAAAEARAARAGLQNVIFDLSDAQIHPLPAASFDLVLSRMAVMFFADPLAGLQSLASALRRSGRMVLMTWQSPAANEWIQTIVEAVAAELPSAGPPPAGAPGPFAFADPDRVRPMLDAAGLRKVTVTPVIAPLRFGRDVDDALSFIAGFGAPKAALAQLDPEAGSRLLARLRSDLEPHAGPDGISMGAAAWIYTARR